MRHQRMQVMSDVNILTIDEDGPPSERVGIKHPRICVAASVGIGMLIDVA